MEGNNSAKEPFAVKDCALVAIATGLRAQNLRELRDNIMHVHPGSIYYHFWGGLLRPQFDNPEYLNDFASWARYGLNDLQLAERLAVVDPTDFSDLEDLREALVYIVEDRLDETELVPWAKSDNQFHFMRSQIVVFDTNRRIEDPTELVHLIPRMSASSIFYHFIDARRRLSDSIDDFRAWLYGFGDRFSALCLDLGAVDPYFNSLVELREELSALFKSYLGGADA